MAALLVMLGGCDTMYDVAVHPVTLGAAAVSVATVVVTDKTVPDHVVSLVTGHDCSLVRYSTGGYYCVQPLPANTPVETRLYCYRSIGSITCYDNKLPGEDNRMVIDPRHVVSSRTLAGPMAGPLPGQR
ncbi:hypothetical protein [Roseospira visakhapatnamensis]|uniref:Uncharacterized protein n=1 Tax=Roseospira visakhapatnamensis TaxID=390880 RepID=A0A7W6RGJ8_9PROT|nr:hypothetical protein [Roseospira visakhapatnamensis]MBB4268181.1 hypothetical protein [Roseospira visakhapatnamensis]